MNKLQFKTVDNFCYICTKHRVTHPSFFFTRDMNQDDIYSRSRLLLGDKSMNRLNEIKVIIFGIGGVGSWAAETLLRTGVTHLTIVDFDIIASSNINRQMPAMATTVGMSKVDVMARRLHDINPWAEVTAINAMYTPDTADDFCLDDYDYVIDAIDSLRDKALLINRATRAKTKLFSSMGAALKLDPTKIQITEFDKAKGCRLAAALRNKFKRTGEFPSRKFKVVFSPEIVENRGVGIESGLPSPINKAITNGSVMQSTAVFGIMLASLVINDCASKEYARQ